MKTMSEIVSLYQVKPLKVRQCRGISTPLLARLAFNQDLVHADEEVYALIDRLRADLKIDISADEEFPFPGVGEQVFENG